MILLLLLGAVLALPLRAVWSGPSLPAWGQTAPSANDQLMAKILAAQLPLLTGDASHKVYLPGVMAKDGRYSMPMTKDPPWGAIGYIDNGCTGVLIDTRHVLAAAHCFSLDPVTAHPNAGDWQGPLYFFPNYHPNRANPPFYLIDRAVVGSRVPGGGGQLASDWGIGHLATPVTDFPHLALQPVPSSLFPLVLKMAGYPRDPIIFPSKESSYPAPPSPPPRPCCPPTPKPLQAGVSEVESYTPWCQESWWAAGDCWCPNFRSACWWIPALIDPYCIALNDNNDAIARDDASCPVQGGNSGSPLLWDIGTPGAPNYVVAAVISGTNVEPSAARFKFAPWFAGGVALASYDDGSDKSQVFASDGDLNRIVRRHRDGTTTDDGFTNYSSLGVLGSPPGRMAAFKLTNNRPQVAVIYATGGLYTSYVQASGSWSSWSSLGKPGAVGGFLDVDAAYDANGTNQLYAIGDDHQPYTLRRNGTAPYASFGNWQPLASAGNLTFERITAIRHQSGQQQVLLVTTTGQLYTMWQISASPTSAWTTPSAFDEPANMTAMTDIDAAWAYDERVQVFGIDTNGGLWTRSIDGTAPGDGWEAWQVWDVPLYSPKRTAPAAMEDLVTLTASRWQEPSGDVIVPVVLATDGQGNIYYTEYKPGGWQAWRSFYD